MGDGEDYKDGDVAEPRPSIGREAADDGGRPWRIADGYQQVRHRNGDRVAVAGHGATVPGD